MGPIRRLRPSFAEVTAILALFIALGGSAWAVAANSVGTKQLKNNAVKAKKIARGAVTTPKIARGAVTTAKLASGIEGAPGPPGEQGPVGPTFATAFANSQDPVPPATPDVPALNGQYIHTFVTPTPGRLLVFASLRGLAIGCTAGLGYGFIYLDGVGVAGSGQAQPSVPNPHPFAPIALTGVVPAGEHTLTIALDCPGGDRMNDTSSGDGDLGAILIGG